MWSRLLTILCGSALCLGLAVMPAQALTTRVKAFSLQCDGTSRNVIFNADNMGASVNRFVVGAGLSLIQPRGGIRSLRLQAVPGDITSTLLLLGLNETKGQVIFTAFMTVASNAAGNIPMQIVGACNGGGSLQGFATVYFFS